MEEMSMFSEVLAELDRNTVRDMVEEQQEEINRLNEKNNEMIQKKNLTIKNSYALYKKMGMDDEKALQTVSEVFEIDADEARRCVDE